MGRSDRASLGEQPAETRQTPSPLDWQLTAREATSPAKTQPLPPSGRSKGRGRSLCMAWVFLCPLGWVTLLPHRTHSLSLSKPSPPEAGKPRPSLGWRPRAMQVCSASVVRTWETWAHLCRPRPEYVCNFGHRLPPKGSTSASVKRSAEASFTPASTQRGPEPRKGPANGGRPLMGHLPPATCWSVWLLYVGVTSLHKADCS